MRATIESTSVFSPDFEHTGQESRFASAKLLTKLDSDKDWIKGISSSGYEYTHWKRPKYFKACRKRIIQTSGKNIHSYRIPNSVTKIGDGAFRGCKNLLSIDIPRSVTSISNCAFSDCTSLLSVDIPDTVSSIEGGTFSTCRSLQRISIPNSVTSIGRNPFLFCDFNSITIPDSVKSIGDYAFLHCESLKAIHIKVKNPNNIILGKDIFSCEAEESCVLFVPSDSLKEYCNHPIFSKFKNIVTE